MIGMTRRNFLFNKIMIYIIKTNEFYQIKIV